MLSAGKNLKFLIQGAGYTQEEAAKLLGITRQTLSNYLKMAEMPADFLQNVKTILKIDVESKPKHTLYREDDPRDIPDLPTNEKEWDAFIDKVLDNKEKRDKLANALLDAMIRRMK